MGAGLAIGATGVWALAAAARVGVLRALLDLFPRGSWDAVTWVLIPLLLLAPIVIQGIAVAAFADGATMKSNPAAWASTAAGAAAGSLLALAVFGAGLLVGVRQLPRDPQVWLGRTAPEALIIAFSGTVLAGWLIVAARLARASWLRRAAVPVAAAVVALAWIRAHHMVIALSYVLDRPEANGFFAAVAVGGAVGSAWAARREVSHGN
jgi:cytochrome b subunit of formate dehydrogenase